MSQPPTQQETADSLLSQARQHYRLAEYSQAYENLVAALYLYKQLQQPHKQADALIGLGLVHWRLANYIRSLQTLRQALTLCQQIGADAEEISCLNNLGIVYGSAGEYKQALAAFARAQVLYDRPDSTDQGFALNNMGMVYLAMGEVEEARRCVAQSLQIAQQQGNMALDTVAQDTMGGVYLATGNLEEALACFMQSIHLARSRGSRHDELSARLNVARVYERQQEWSTAVSAWHQALQLAEEIGARDEMRICHDMLTRLYKQLAQFELALVHHEQFHALDRALADNLAEMRFRILESDHQLEVAQKEAELMRQQNLLLEQEIAERKQVEDFLRQSEARVRLLFEQTADYALLMRFFPNEQEPPIIVDCNEAACQKHGYTRAELIGQPVTLLSDPGEYRRMPALLQQLLHDGSIAIETVHRCKDGSTFPVEVVAKLVEMGQERYIYSIERDITRRIQMEAELRSREEVLRTLTEASPDPIYFKDGEGRWLLANGAGLRLFGLQNAAYFGRTNLELAQDVPFFTEALHVCVHTDELAWQRGEMTRTLETVPQPDGPPRLLDVIKVPLLTEDGRRKGLVVLGRDVTEQKRAEEALLLAQKTESLGVLAGGVAHDFNNLLVAILGQTSLAMAKLPPGSHGRRHLEKAVRAAERAAELTQKMLAYSGRGHFQMALLDLNELIVENLGLFRAAVPKNVRMVSNLMPELPLIQADVGQIQQVVMNLILNGAEAIGTATGKLTVATNVEKLDGVPPQDWRFFAYPPQPGEYVALIVQDDGVGMSDEQVRKIFDPFFTTKESGHGLGLAAVLGIVRGHKGGIGVRSEPGQGTTMKLFFPLASTAKTESARPLVRKTAVSPINPAPSSVLLIDTEAGVLETARNILSLEGLNLLTAANGREGIALYQQYRNSIKLVLLDHAVPGLSSAEIIHQLRQINPAVRILLSSVYTQTEAAHQFHETGIIGFIQKPYNAITFSEVVHKYLL